MSRRPACPSCGSRVGVRIYESVKHLDGLYREVWCNGCDAVIDKERHTPLDPAVVATLDALHVGFPTHTTE